MWPSFIKRMRAEADRVLRNNKSKGAMRVKVELYIDADGQPIAWIIDSSARIEPSRSAQDAVDLICGIT